MDDKERYERGMTQAPQGARQCLGRSRPTPNKTPFNAEFQDFITRYRLGRDLDAPAFRRAHAARAGDRHLIGARHMGRNSACMCARALVEGGFSADDIKEIILQQAIYCGVPVGQPRLQGSRRGDRRGRQRAK